MKPLSEMTRLEIAAFIGGEFKHPQTPFLIEFPPDPLGVGDELPLIPSDDLTIDLIKSYAHM
jgi:hypothetical protein